MICKPCNKIMRVRNTFRVGYKYTYRQIQCPSCLDSHETLEVPAYLTKLMPGLWRILKAGRQAKRNLFKWKQR